MAIMDLLRRWSDGRTATWRDLCPILEGNADEYRASHTDEEWLVDSFWNQLDSECRKRYQRAWVGEDQEPLGASPQIMITPDKMTAYLCVLPPQTGGAALTEEQLRQALEDAGVRTGVAEDALSGCVQDKRYLEIFPIAFGTQPLEGREGRVEPLYEAIVEEPFERADGQPLDFAELQLPQPVQEGETICNIILPSPGKDGVDVTGRPVPCGKYRYPDVPAGENTNISPEGARLYAEKEGLVWFKDGKFHVREQKFISGSITTPGGSCRIRGSLLITANVSGGATVTAGGDICIAGEVNAGTVISTGGSIRVLRGIYGTPGKTVIRAAAQVQAPIIEKARVEAGSGVITEQLLDCDVVSGGSVHVTGGKGTIVGGHVQAEKLVQCRQLGNVTGKRNQITVGFSPALAAERERIQAELDVARKTLDTLWKRISELKKAGRLISDEKRELLEQLVEQRTLYESHEADLKLQQNKLLKEMREMSEGRVLCAQLYGRTKVQIGGCTGEFNAAEKDCDIHASAGGNLVLH